MRCSAPRLTRSLPRLIGAALRTGRGAAASRPWTTSTTFPSGSVNRTRRPPPGASMSSMPDAPSRPAAASRSPADAASKPAPMKPASPFFRRVDERRRVGRPRVERAVRRGNGRQPEIRQEGLHGVEVGSAEADVRNVLDLDHVRSFRFRFRERARCSAGDGTRRPPSYANCSNA